MYFSGDANLDETNDAIFLELTALRLLCSSKVKK